MKCLFAFEAHPLDAVDASLALKKVASQVNILPANPFQNLRVEVKEAEGSLRPERDLSKISYFGLSLEVMIYCSKKKEREKESKNHPSVEIKFLHLGVRGL